MAIIASKYDFIIQSPNFFGYLEDMFRLDSDTLDQNGLNSSFEPKKEPPRLEQTDDNRRDIKEPV